MDLSVLAHAHALRTCPHHLSFHFMCNALYFRGNAYLYIFTPSPQVSQQCVGDVLPTAFVSEPSPHGISCLYDSVLDELVFLAPWAFHTVLDLHTFQFD